LPTDDSAGEHSTPKVFPSKTAAKKAVKAAKALKRLRDQEGQNNTTPVEAEQMVKPIVDEAVVQRTTRQQETRRQKKASQRRRRAE